MTSAVDDVRTWREELAHAKIYLEQTQSAILQLYDVESDRRSAAATQLQAAACGFLARRQARQAAALRGCRQRLAVFRLRHVTSTASGGAAACCHSLP
jgi:hypothetical protein